MDYARILAQAWDYTRRFKALWLFGLLATCGTYHGGMSNNFNFNLRPHGSAGIPPDLPPRMAQWFTQIDLFFRRLSDTQILLLAGAIIALALGISLVLWVLGRYGKAGVLRGALAIAEGGEPPTFDVLARETLDFAARLILADLVVLVAMFGLMLVLVPLFILLSIFTLGLGVVLMMCLLTPAALLLKLYFHLVHLVLVAEPEAGILEAFRLAWERLRERFWEWLIMGLLLGLIGFIVRLILLIPAAALIFGAVMAFMQGTAPIGWLFGGLLLLYTLLAWMVGGVLATFRLSAWALTYRELVSLPITTDEPLPPPPPPTPTPEPPEAPTPPDEED
ncbi:MAG TPA: hypothetical protein G4O04_05610 [Anaerolineae bacterium]|nr:hypothetical protein [Anaerolineae bacterium]HIQ09387.1 hypothetical protein [Anaerolineaceae bacterium]